MTSNYKSMESKKQNHEGLRLKDFRTKKGISQKELAEILGCSQPNLSKIESGELGLSNSLREKIFIHYQELNPTWLFSGMGEMLQEAYDSNVVTDHFIKNKDFSELRELNSYFEVFQKLIDQGKVPNTVISTIFSDMRKVVRFQEKALETLKKSNDGLLESLGMNVKLMKKLMDK